MSEERGRGKAVPCTINVRPEIAAFALAMEHKLAENDHKPHWTEPSKDTLICRTAEEFGELCEAVEYEHGPEAVTLEAADMANFGMFLADKSGGLKPWLDQVRGGLKDGAE